MLSNSLTERKKVLLDKVSNILSSGNFKTKNDIYAQVFDTEELDTLGQTYPELKEIKSDDKNKTKTKNTTKTNNSVKNTEEDKKDDAFFVTQVSNKNVNENK